MAKKGRKPRTAAPKSSQNGTGHARPTIRQQLANNDPPWTVYEVAADGNCLFRSLFDQLRGAAGVNVGDHAELRQRLVDYIAQEREFYKFFLEDDEDIDAYTRRMRKDQTWGGHVEIHACARLFGVNIRIYQDHSPAWNVKEWPEETTMMLYVSYHDGNHYNSVRGRASQVPASMADGLRPAIEPGVQTATWDNARDQDKNEMPDVDQVALKKGQCPCGSGKKFRKCCKKRERLAERAVVVGECVEELAAAVENIDI